MDSYELRWKMSAVKELKALPKRTRERVLLAVSSLVTEPFPPGSRKLRASPTGSASATTVSYTLCTAQNSLSKSFVSDTAERFTETSVDSVAPPTGYRLPPLPLHPCALA